MDGAIGKLVRVSGALLLAGLGSLVSGAAPADNSLPDPAAFADGASSGRLDPETFDFATAGFWTLQQHERAQWQTAVFEGIRFGTPSPDGCAPEAQRSYVTGIWVMLGTQSADAAEWQAAHQALRERLTKLDARLANVTASKPGADPVVQELLVRFARDQDIRSVFTEPQWLEGMPPLAAKNWTTFFVTRMSAIDCDNTAWLRAQLAQVGWFGIPKYGADVDSAAWHLVQHADLNRPFQREMLARLQALPPGETDAKRVGFLWDRVARADGRPQRYGTQGSCNAGVWTPHESEDPANLDKRRASLGMRPIAEHAAITSRERCPK